MGWLAAQGAIMAIGLFIGLVCSVIGLFFGHIILFDSIALGIAAGVCCNQFTAIHPALCLVIGIATFLLLLWLQNTSIGFWLVGGLLTLIYAAVFGLLAYFISEHDPIWGWVIGLNEMFKIVEREDDIIANEEKVFDGFLASADKGTHARRTLRPAFRCVIVLDRRQPACVLCLAKNVPERPAGLRVFPEHGQQLARQTRRAGCRPPTRITKPAVAQARENHVGPCQLTLRTINTEILGADLIAVGLILRALTVETLFVKIKVHLTKRFFILTERSFACNVFSCTF